MKTREVILVVLFGHERHLRSQRGQIKMNAVHLIHRHLPWPELCALHAVAQLTKHQCFVQCFLFGKARGVNR